MLIHYLMWRMVSVILHQEYLLKIMTLLKHYLNYNFEVMLFIMVSIQSVNFQILNLKILNFMSLPQFKYPSYQELMIS